MGWKTACIVTSDAKEPAYFGTLPQHLPDEATRIAKLLGYEFVSRESVPFDDYPKERTFVIGAYEKGTYLADQDIIYECFDNREHPYLKSAMQLYPQGSLLMVIAHSVVNLFGYAYYENGKLIREYSGSGDDGVLSEFGEIQPEEAKAFEASEVRDEQRFFKVEYQGETEEYTADCYGEDLCFMMLGKYFSNYMAGNVFEELTVERFVKGRNKGNEDAAKGNDSLWSHLQRLFGR